MNLKTEKLRKSIKEKGLNQTSLASLLGLSRFTIANVCRGASCREETALKIAEALQMPLHELIERR